jgi:hypothetical protein
MSFGWAVSREGPDPEVDFEAGMVDLSGDWRPG